MRESCLYSIEPLDDGTWCVCVEGPNEGPQRFDTKAEALAYAETAASIHGPCRVALHHADGSFDREIAYGKPPDADDLR